MIAVPLTPEPEAVPHLFALVMQWSAFQSSKLTTRVRIPSKALRDVGMSLMVFRRHRANGVMAHDGKTNNVRLAVGNPHPVFGGVPKRQRELTVNQWLRLRGFESCRHHETPWVSAVSQDTVNSFYQGSVLDRPP